MHNIGYLVYSEKANKNIVMDEIHTIARRNGDGYNTTMKWHDELPPFETEAEAHQWIEEHDNGWYDDHAVLFRDYSNAKKTKKIEEYENKIAELYKAEREYRQAHSVKKLQASLIGCTKCNSKLSKEYLRGEYCPLCGTDLRSKTTLDKLEWYKSKRNEYEKRIEDEKKKQKDSCKIMWLIKYEYHS